MNRIWVPKTKIIEPTRELVVPHRLVGMFKLEAIRPDGRRRLLADWFPNLITNAGLNAVGTVLTWMTACKVGTGSSTPNVLDTALDAQVAGSDTQFSLTPTAQSSAPYYCATTIVYRFAAGVAAGNLQEIGISTQKTVGGILFSRALILDGAGNPTTITVLSDEVLDATYQCRLYVPTADVVNVISIGGVNYDYTLRACNVTNTSYWRIPAIGGGNTINLGCVAYDGAIGIITGQPSGATSGVNSTVQAYGDGNFFRDSVGIWGLTDANFAGGIDAVRHPFGTPAFGSIFGTMQVGFTPAIPKDGTKTLSLVFRAAWARGTI